MLKCDDEAALRAAAAIAEELRRLLMAPSGDPPLDIDADLRPEGDRPVVQVGRSTMQRDVDALKASC